MHSHLESLIKLYIQYLSTECKINDETKFKKFKLSIFIISSFFFFFLQVETQFIKIAGFEAVNSMNQHV